MKNGFVLRRVSIGGLSLLATCISVSRVQAQPTTPDELVAAYDSLADTLLGAIETEQHLVESILTTTYDRGQTALGEARSKVQAGQSARSEIERLAALVAQLGNEGDAAVAGIRKRLVEGGHHHNTAGEQQGIYDEGFVVVTRQARKTFLDAATEIGRLTGSANADALDAQWSQVESQFRELMEGDRP